MPSRSRRIPAHVLEQVKRERVNDFKRKADQDLGLKKQIQQVHAEYEMHTEKKAFKEGFQKTNRPAVEIAEDRSKALQDLVAQVFFEDTDLDEEGSGDEEPLF